MPWIFRELQYEDPHHVLIFTAVVSVVASR